MKESDRYFTSDEILALVLEQWGEVDLDPCWDPECQVIAGERYDIRQGQDGLLLPWFGRVWLNPPYSETPSWLVRAAQHAHGGGEVLGLIPAAIDTLAWHRSVWPWASVCALSPRPRFTRPASVGKVRSAALVAHAVIYYGPHHQRFSEVWCARGEIVTSQRLHLARKA